MTFLKRNVLLWAFIIVVIFLFNQTPLNASSNKALGTPRYYPLDRTTTLVIPDDRFPVLCTYVESRKIPERQVTVAGRFERLPAVFTSGMGCVLMPKEMFDEFLERYP